MLRRRVNGYDMAYVELGEGAPLVCIHGSLGDFRTWSPVMGPLSKRYRLIVPSLRHFFPEHWDGIGDDYTMAQHVADVIAFIEALGVGAVHLMGHSRGGHVSFRVAQQRPALVHRLILAEPGGELDASLGEAGSPTRQARIQRMADLVAAGEADAALTTFIEAVEGQASWQALPPGARQQFIDNARTLIGQARERRRPFSRPDAEAIRAPTLFIGGADTPGNLPAVLRALAAHVPDARTVIIPRTRHFMFDQDPAAYCAAVTAFLG